MCRFILSTHFSKYSTKKTSWCTFQIIFGKIYYDKKIPNEPTIHNKVEGKKVWLSIDGTTEVEGQYVASVIGT